MQLDEGKLTGIKTWCSASSWVESGLLTYRDEQNRSQLLIVDMQQPGIQHDHTVWQALGMQHTSTAQLEFNQVPVKKLPIHMLIWIGWDSGMEQQALPLAGMVRQ